MKSSAMKIKNFFQVLSLALLASASLPISSAQAIEPQDPKTVCDRFVTDLDKTNCEDQMRALKPDWYLAALCTQQFDDKAFYSCMNVTRLGTFSPEKLDRCSVVETTDEGRTNCARRSLTAKAAEVYQPATAKKAPRGSLRLSEAGGR